MRRFIYLDTDTLNSYIAQIYDGLVQSEEVERQASSGGRSEDSHIAGADVGVDFKLFGKGLEGKIDYTYQHLKETSNSELISDVQTKLLHDNAFDQLMNYLDESKMLHGNEIGDFVFLQDEFYILDLDFYQKVFSDKKTMEYFKKAEQEKGAEKLKVLQDIAKTEPDANINAINKKYSELQKEANAKINEQFNGIKEVFEIMQIMVPYKKTLCIADNMVVLNEKYLRDDLSVISFKYGGRIKLLGYITNRISQDDKDIDNPIVDIGHKINEVMIPFLSKGSALSIVHPIALYYE